MKPRLPILSLLAFMLKWLPLVSTNDCLFSTCEARRISSGLTSFNIIYGLFGGEVRITCGLTAFTTVDNWTLTTRQDNQPMESVILSTNRDLVVTNLTASNTGQYTCKRGMSSLWSGCIFVLKPAMFASCSGPVTVGVNKYTCDESSRPLMAVENGSVTLDTRVVYEANEGGPCGFTESVMRVALVKDDDADSMNLFFCFISGQSVNDPTVFCDNSGIEGRIVQTSQPMTRNTVLDFNLIYHDLTLSDSGLYRYTIELEQHLTVPKQTRTLVKEFTINVTVPPKNTTTPEPTTTSSNTTSTESSVTEPRSASIAPIVVPIVVVIAIVIAVVITVVIVIVLKHSAWTGRQGTVSFKSQNDNDYLQADGLIVNTSNNSLLRPSLDSKGRPLSYIDNFPGTLNEVRDSAPADI